MTKAAAVTTLVLVLASVGAALLLWPDPHPAPAVSAVETRGRLLDYAGTPLTGVQDRWQPALNVAAFRRLDSAQAVRFAAELAHQLHVDEERMLSITARASGGERQLPASLLYYERDRVAKWLQDGEWRREPQLVRFLHKPIRTYPQSDAMAPVVGITNVDGYGIEGLELQHNAVLRAGADVRVSIEIDKQRAVANQLAYAVQENGVEEVGAIVVELATGRVAAMVSLPSYDPLDIPNRHGAKLRLKPVTDVFQPGPMLQPFLLYGVLAAALPERNAMQMAFVEGRADAGVAMAQVLGRGGILMSLKRSGLSEPLRVDFPGRADAMLRRDVTTDELLREFGNGEAIATSLLQYSMSLASILTGVRPATTVLASRADRVATPNLATERITAPAADDALLASALRDEMVKHARRVSGDLLADFGGLWNVYREKEKGGEGVRRGVVALFAPATNPRYLLVVNARLGREELAADALLKLGTDVLNEISEPATVGALRPLAAQR